VTDGRTPPRITRRRLLASAGAAATVALVGLGIEVSTQSKGGGTSPGNGPSPLAAGDVAGPSASASPSPGPRRVYRSRPDIAAPIVEIETLAGVATPGHIFLTPSNGAGSDGPMIVDETGQLVWMRPGTGKAATNLRVGTLRGATVLTWWEGANNAGIGTGEHVIVDTAYREIGRIRAGGGRTADLHELLFTNHNTAFILADAAVKNPASTGGSAAPSVPIMDCAVQEVDLASGNVQFEWHSVDHVGADETVVPPPTTPNAIHDYFHANSLEVDTDGNLIVSARNTSTIYKVDRGSGRILWRLGGHRSDFAMGPGSTFGLQHDARRQADGTLTVFDDANDPGPSRGIALRLDESAMTATLVREFRQPQGRYATSQGNMQVLPSGSVFIGWGSVPRFSEFTADGRLVLDAGFTATQSYRDLRFPWSAQPAEPPALAVDRSADGLVVFASWNGATDVASWEVLLGPAPASLARATVTPRTGFETIIRVPSVPVGTGAVAVRALDVAGMPMATSKAIAVPG
jgi:hypothetical protein